MPDSNHEVPPHEVPPFVKHLGNVIAGIGLLLFLSTFVSAALNFGNFDDFDSRGRSMSLRSVGGFILMIAGGAIQNIVSRKNKTSGDPVGQGGWSAEDDHDLVGPIKIRCQNCRALNDEAAKFCDQCGQNL